MIEEISKEIERAAYYKFLSECYYLPDEKQIEVLKCYKDSASQLFSEIEEHLPSKQDIKPLMVDYAKLFVGPFELLAPPYGSIYLEGGKKLLGDSSADVEQWYAEEGIKVDIKEIPDHITIELEFMYLLISKKNDAISKDDANMVRHYQQKELSFLNIHLGNWVMDFTKQVEKHAKTEYYKKIAQITSTFIRNDNEYLLIKN